MADLADVISYICFKYPHKGELSNARVTKLVYLSDWEAVKATGRQITSIKWYFNNYGPFVHDVAEAATRDPRLATVTTENIYGDRKVQITYIGRNDPGIELSSSERGIVDRVILETQTLYWDGFIRHVYETPPIARSNRYTDLRLEEFL